MSLVSEGSDIVGILGVSLELRAVYTLDESITSLARSIHRDNSDHVFAFHEWRKEKIYTILTNNLIMGFC